MRPTPFLPVMLVTLFLLMTLFSPNQSAWADGPPALKKFLGKWECIEFIQRGIPFPMLEGKNKITVTITDKDFVFGTSEGKQKMNLQARMFGKKLLAGLSVGKDPRVQFIIDDTTNPKTLNHTVMTPYGPTGMKGIYKLEDNVLWWCIAKDLPRQFSATKESGQTLIKLKRVKS